MVIKAGGKESSGRQSRKIVRKLAQTNRLKKSEHMIQPIRTPKGRWALRGHSCAGVLGVGGEGQGLGGWLC